MDNEVKYRAVAHYEPAHDDEIKLEANDSVVILHAYDDGWVLGRNESSSAIGLLPKNFLARVTAPPTAAAQPPPSASVPADSEKLMLRRGSSIFAVQPNQPLPEDDDDENEPTSFPASVAAAASVTPSADGDDLTSWSAPTDPVEISALASLDSKGAPLEPPVVVSAGPSSSAPLATSPAPAPHAPVTAASSSEAEQERLQAAREKFETVNARRALRSKIPANVGALKIAVVGDSGIGKTSLIHNFFALPEVCDKEVLHVSDEIGEVRASTIPSTGLHTSEEPWNLTFVDTPGFGIQMDAMLTIKPIIDYHHRQFITTNGVLAPNAEIPNLVPFL
ncbi:hypothetical protein BDK51DRAFT_32394, partial [Blyttiomyces helicus]